MRASLFKFAARGFYRGGAPNNTFVLCLALVISVELLRHGGDLVSG